MTFERFKGLEIRIRHRCPGHEVPDQFRDGRGALRVLGVTRDLIPYRPFQTGSRFSANARAPSS